MADYRRCAGVIVFNRNKKVLVCARIDNRDMEWQFPQGGILKKEMPAVAAVRELEEETSIRSVTVVKTLEEPLRYDFPNSVKNKLAKRGIKSLGQDMFWSLLYFYGSDEEINVATKQPEFKAWAWVDIEEAPKRIVYFKKEVYTQAVRLLKPIMDNFEI